MNGFDVFILYTLVFFLNFMILGCLNPITRDDAKAANSWGYLNMANLCVLLGITYYFNPWCFNHECIKNVEQQKPDTVIKIVVKDDRGNNLGVVSNGR